MQHVALRRLWREAILVVYLHGGTVVPRPLVILQKLRPNFNELKTIDTFFDCTRGLSLLASTCTCKPDTRK